VREVAQLGPPGVHGQVCAPEQPLHTGGFETRLEHAPVHSAPREIDVYVRRRAECRQRMLPVAAPTDVGENESHVRMARGQGDELGAVRRLLSRPVAPAVLPYVM